MAVSFREHVFCLPGLLVEVAETFEVELKRKRDYICAQLSWFGCHSTLLLNNFYAGILPTLLQKGVKEDAIPKRWYVHRKQQRYNTRP